jgi:hypothetical protein
MDSIGKHLLDPARQPFFNVRRFEGLFEAIGPHEVQLWMAKYGNEPIRYIAYQLDSPRLQDSEPFIPPVTEWVMTQFGADDQVFREFCAGRHAFEVQEGHARSCRANLEKSMAPFLKHPQEWVLRWAKWELKENEYEAKLDDYIDDRHERM